jgi:hypothetical protein
MPRLFSIISIFYSIIVRVETNIGYFIKLGYKSSNILKILFIFKKYSYSARIYLVGLNSYLYLFGKKYK